MRTHQFQERYQQTCREVEQEFERNRRLHGARIQCRSGCSDCCHQLFQITEIEAELIWQGVQAMAPEARERLQAKARDYLAEREKLTGGPEQWGKLPPEGTRLACPALTEDGACGIYEHRPLICRRFGMPIFNPDRPDRVVACQLNFKPGDAIEDGQLVQIQTGIHHRWKAVQREYNEAGGYRSETPICVGSALIARCSDSLT